MIAAALSYAFGFCVVSLIVFLIAYKLFPHKITAIEILIGVVVQICGVVMIYVFASYGAGKDTQILNGEVTGKYRDTVMCSHSYSCNCRTICSGSGKSRSCSQRCDTCYEHSNDFDWVVETSVGNLVIDRVDRQGTTEPLRWSEVEKGEPASAQSSYYNYIKASPLSLFNREQLEAKVHVPGYFQVYDYYRVNRVSNASRFSVNSQLNDLLNLGLRKLGPSHKANVRVILHSNGADYLETVRAKELGGKINDVTVLIGLSDDGSIVNAGAFSWSRSDTVNVSIRTGILELEKYDARRIASIILYAIEHHFQYRSIKEFEYLENEAPLPDWAFVLLFVFGFGFPFVYSAVAARYEIA